MIAYDHADYVNYRLNRARETIREVDVLIKNRFWNTAVNIMYYACFYAVSALMFKNEIHVLSHSGLRLKFGQLYVKTGKISKELGKHYSDLFEKRTKGDYNDFFDFDEDTVLSLYEPSKRLINKIEDLIKG